jgi:hypothetical protein
MKKQKFRALGILSGFAVAVVATSLIGTHGTAAADSMTPGSCEAAQLHVALAPGMPASQTINGTLCSPSRWKDGQHRIDVLAHGASYNSSYWSWPVKTTLYSYVNDTLLAGRATFAYDAVGAGTSSHPLSATVSIDNEAFVLHQVLDWLRDKHQYTKYDAVGHSKGSMAVVKEASTYHDEDTVVLTGYTHAANPINAAIIQTKLYPANQDPQFAGKGYDDGYLTSKPGERKIFYGSSADPEIVAYDEAHKDVFPGTALGTGIGETLAPPVGNVANGVTAPILEVIGQEDFLYCGMGAIVDCSSPAAVQAFDTPYFSHASSLTVQTIAATGHDLALHPTNPFSFFGINQWIETH